MALRFVQHDHSRRRFLAGVGGLGSLLLLGRPGAVLANWKPQRNPFTLGVASGNPRPNGVVLWTRLAPDPLAPGGGMPAESVAVEWDLAEDAQFSKGLRSGRSFAIAGEGHSVHVELVDLPPDSHWYYRFRAGDAISAVGRTRTAPAADGSVDRLRLALASCAHYEHGLFVAYRELGEADLDLIVHVGDYIYENAWGVDPVRRFGAPEPMTLEDYRQRHALYKLDPNLQLAHANHPWLFTWDDHEVDNDYAGALGQDRDPEGAFLLRRAAAYQAYYEHLPLSRAQVMQGPWMRLHDRFVWGQLADLHLLDCRQYRSVQPCRPPGQGGSSNLAGCEARLDPNASMLGAAQEAWFYNSLSNSQQRWNLIAQSTLFAPKDGDPGEAEVIWTDGWDGYAANRARMIESMRGKANPVLLGGDVHAHYVANVNADDGSTIASEFCGTSITSQAWPQEKIASELPANPHLLLGDGSRRGYVAFDLRPGQLQADLRVFENVRDRNARGSSLAKFAVNDGKPGPLRS